MEERAAYRVAANDPLAAVDNNAILYVKPALSTRNLEELERDLAKLERMLTPLLNQVRAMLGKESKDGSRD